MIGALVGVWALAPIMLAAARWPTWWAWIAPELTPMTWLQSTGLLLAAAAALLLAHTLQLFGLDERSDVVTWRLLAMGMAALAVDERFALHERLRDGVLAPSDVTVGFLPWVAPGDFLLLVIAVVGLALLPRFQRALDDDRGARRALLLAVVLSAIAVGMDSINPSSWTVAAERLEQTVEEVIELGGTLALLATVALRMLGILDLAAPPTPTGPSDADDQVDASRP